MGNDSESGLSDSGISLMQILIEISVVRFNDIWETMQQISHCDNDVIFNH